MATHVRCGGLFTGHRTAAQSQCTVIYGDEGVISYVGATKSAPPVASGDTVLDYGALFVLPGLIDVHVHLAYGNAKSEEDIDLYHSLEFRALRGLFFAQKVLAAGYTSICSPGDSGQVSLAVRDAINANLFDGPRVTAAGPYITSRQGLTDWYPTWIGVPETAIGTLVTSRDQALEVIRVQVKNGVDYIKLAMDGVQKRPDGELIAAFNEEETKAMVAEAHRLGRKVIVHARGREAVLYAARAGVDLIFHAYYIDDECIEAIVKAGSLICPTMTPIRNAIDFTQPHEPAAKKGRIARSKAEYEVACRNLQKARLAGIPMLAGTDSGFATTPYGEWHAKELEIFVRDLGFSPVDALNSTTELAAGFILNGSKVGVLAEGRFADFIAVDGLPLEDITILQDKARIRHVHLSGKRTEIADRDYDPTLVTDKALVSWSDLYTQKRVRELGIHTRSAIPTVGSASPRGEGTKAKPPKAVRGAD